MHLLKFVRTLRAKYLLLFYFVNVVSKRLRFNDVSSMMLLK